MKLVIGSDHAGFPLKEEIKKHLDERGLEYEDVGTYDTKSCDYPVYAEKLCGKITSGECYRGILCCGTGIGMSICANKVNGIRAAACSDCFSAKFTRAHNDANVLCLGARVVGAGLADELVDLFIDTEFEGGRHQRRVDLITEIEKKN
jgi:ribose 5-phosphate isomerase B